MPIHVTVTGLFSPIEGDEYHATVSRIFDGDEYGGFETLDEAIRDLRAGLNRTVTEEPPHYGSEGNLIAIEQVRLRATSDGPYAYWNTFRGW